MRDDLLKALEASDEALASKSLEERIRKGDNPWEIHLSLFPLVQRVLNPPFINPHLPKMYRIYREFKPCLREDEILPLVRLEITEYARRSKLEKFPKPNLLTSPVSFKDIESAIRAQDHEKTALLMATFYSQKGGEELARQFLLLGSGYLDHSLGHSISCTAFILLEMLDRNDQDSWPALMTLADYFCKGKFQTTPGLPKSIQFFSGEEVGHHLERATSGRGIVNLHHTITLYAIERVCRFFSQEEHYHLIGAWIAFMGDKEAEQLRLSPSEKRLANYAEFFKIFSRLDAKGVVESVGGMIFSDQGRQQLARFLIRGVCDLYQGNYNPHNLTGLGSALWVIDRYWDHASIAVKALFQYLDFFFSEIKS
jgi:hypothetical protein